MSDPQNHLFQLPKGESYTVQHDYSSAESAGVTTLAVAAAISCISTATLLILLVLSATRRFQAPGQVVFIRTHVAPYFVSLLFCDFWQSIGSLLSIEWVTSQRVHVSTTCTAQAAIKNGGNVGTAIWSLAIALHTFFVLFVGRRPWEPALYLTLILSWSLIGIIVVIGPLAVEDMTNLGPYYGVSGMWCWITENYPLPQLMLEYLWMFSAAGINVVLYLLVYLKLRGNLITKGWRWRLRKAEGKTWDPTTGQTDLQAQVTNITRHMMMFPIVYFLVVIPIAGCRYAEWAGYDVPFELIIFADVIFVLQGFINVVLFCCSRSVIPADHQNLFGSNAQPRSRGKSTQSSDEESSMSMSMTPLTIQHGPNAKPQKIKHINHVISIEPAREPSLPPSRAVSPSPSFSRAASSTPSRLPAAHPNGRSNSFGQVYDDVAGGSRQMHQQADQGQWVSYTSVPTASHSPRLTPAEMGKINAHYAAPGPSRSTTPQPRLAVAPPSALPPRSKSPSGLPPPRSRSPFRIVNATETIGTIADEDMFDAPTPAPMPQPPYMGHARAASSTSSVSSYMTDDSSAPLTATTARGSSRSRGMRERDSGLAFEHYSEHRSHSPVPQMPPTHPGFVSHSHSGSHASSVSAMSTMMPPPPPPPPISTTETGSAGMLNTRMMMMMPALVVQQPSPMSPPRMIPEPISLEAARRAPPSSVPNTARPPTPLLSRTSHDGGSSDSHGGESIYLW